MVTKPVITSCIVICIFLSTNILKKFGLYKNYFNRLIAHYYKTTILIQTRYTKHKHVKFYFAFVPEVLWLPLTQSISLDCSF